MNIIGITKLGNIPVGTTVPYQFFVVDDCCKQAVTDTIFETEVTRGKISVIPKIISTNKFGVAECEIKIHEDATGPCEFKVKC